MMKKYKLFITTIALFTFCVAQSQNLHNAKVMGIIPFGQKDVAIINDLETGEVFKTAVYNKGLLITDEDIQLNFSNPNDENKAKVVKQNLSKIIFCFNENQSNPCNDNLCIKHYGSNMVVVRYTENDFRIVYKARTHNGVINSNVRIFKKNTNGIHKVVYTSFSVDTNIPNYKLSLHNDVIAKANNIKNTLTEVKWNNIAVVYENFLNKFRNRESVAFSSNLGQSTAFHLSIYKTIYRSLVDNSDCNCLPSPLYFGGRTPFMCMKDFVFNVDEMVQTYNENEAELKTKYNEATINVLKDYLSQQTEPNFTFDEMYFSLFTTQVEFENYIAEAACMQGSDLGCCGNYSGCCVYASLDCLAHDVHCLLTQCQPDWYCGSSCVP